MECSKGNIKAVLSLLLSSGNMKASRFRHAGSSVTRLDLSMIPR